MNNKTALFIILTTLIFGSNAYSQNLDSYSKRIGESYLFISRSKHDVFYKNEYFSNVYSNATKYSNANSIQIGIGMRLWHSYFFRVYYNNFREVGSFKEDDRTFGYSGFKYNMMAGIAKHYPLLNNKLFFNVNPNLALVKFNSGHTLYEEFLSRGRYSNFEYSKRTYQFGANLKLELEYSFYKRYSLAAFVEGTRYFTSYLYKSTFYKEHPYNNESVLHHVHTAKPYILNYGITLKMGLEHKSWYKKGKTDFVTNN